MARALFTVAIPQRTWELPPGIGAELFSATSRDGVGLVGWRASPSRPRGTVLMLHGLLRNCTMDGIPGWGARWLERGFATAAIDLRFHGRSQDQIPSFGVAESWDARAALDACAAVGFPRPFVINGGSLGALAAQRAAVDDPRVDGASLLAMPAFPWHGAHIGANRIADLARSELRTRTRIAKLAIGASLAFAGQAGRLVGGLVNASYGFDIMGAGDIRTAPMPAHRPALLSMMGALDGFDWRATAAVWRRRAARGDRPFVTPTQAPGQDSWFVLAPGVGHPPVSPHLLEWPACNPMLEQFVELVAARYRARHPSGPGHHQ